MLNLEGTNSLKASSVLPWGQLPKILVKRRLPPGCQGHRATLELELGEFYQSQPQLLVGKGINNLGGNEEITLLKIKLKIKKI